MERPSKPMFLGSCSRVHRVSFQGLGRQPGEFQLGPWEMSSWNDTFSNGFLGLGFLSHGETSGLGFLLFRSPVGSRQETPAVRVAGGKLGGWQVLLLEPSHLGSQNSGVFLSLGSDYFQEPPTVGKEAPQMQ